MKTSTTVKCTKCGRQVTKGLVCVCIQRSKKREPKKIPLKVPAKALHAQLAKGHGPAPKLNKLVKEESDQATKREAKAKAEAPREHLVYISKAYFPAPAKPGKPGREDFDQWKVKAVTREEAAKTAWKEHGEYLLSMMKPKETTVRKISLYVSNPATGTGAGRLPPIQVYEEGAKLPKSKAKATPPVVTIAEAVAAKVPGDSGPVCSTYVPGQVLIARWDDLEGRHHAPAKVEANNIHYATHIQPPEKGAKKGAKGTKVSDWEGSLGLVLYPVLHPHIDLTLRLEHQLGLPALIGPRNAEYTLRVPTEIEQISVARVIAREMERIANLGTAEANGAKPHREARVRVPGAAKAVPEDDRKITLLKKPNPYKGDREVRFDHLKGCGTVREFVAKLVGLGYRVSQANFILADGAERGLLKLEAK